MCVFLLFLCSVQYVAEAASRACVFVCRALEEMYKKNKQEKLLACPCMPKV